jgi:cytochrome c oxidase subunit 4
MEEEHSSHKYSIGYGAYILIWLILLSYTALTVAVAGVDLKGFTLFIALLIAALKSALVINVFMHIKFDAIIFKIFLGLAIGTLLIVFLLTALDVYNLR